MVKKIVAMFTIAILSLSCSRLQIREEKPQDEKFIQYYNSWEIQKMEQYIQEHIVKSGYTEAVPMYQSMTEERRRAKNELEELVEVVRDEIRRNDLTTLEAYMSSGIRGTAIIRTLRKYDFTGFRIYTSKLKYKDNRAENIVAAIYGEDTLYYDVNYEYKRGRWEIVDFKERR